MSPTLQSIQVGAAREYGDEEASDPMERAWSTGIFKQPVDGPVELGLTNLAGDEQADLSVHGGPDKAVCVYSADHYPDWQEALALDDMGNGAFGENFTLANVTEPDICIGDSFYILYPGETDEVIRTQAAIVQVSQPRQPCWKLARRWRIKTLAAVVQQTGRTGWYFRVLRPGTVAAGMTLQLIKRPNPRWAVAEANRIMHHDKHDYTGTEELANVPELSINWRESLLWRLDRRISRGSQGRLVGPNE